MVSRAFGRDGSAQTAIADAIIALIILTIASTVIYAAVSGTVVSRSDARQRANLRAVAMQAAGLPLEASYPNVSFQELPSGRDHVLLNITGEGILRTLFELQASSNGTGKGYEVTGLENALKALYRWALEGRSYAVNIEGTINGVHLSMLFSSGTDGQGAIKSTNDIPNPRVVVQRTVHDAEGNIVVDLYLWR
jgi:hypothetical protein